MLKTYKELMVWQKAFRLCARVYAVSARFPREERFGLTAQIRRAAVSVPSNIAEGYTRGTTRDYLRFLAIASGSLAEVETQLLLAEELQFSPSESLRQLLDAREETDRMLNALIRSLAGKEGE